MNILHLSRISLLASLLAVAVSASAVTLSIDNPNLVVTRPTSGSQTYTFTGTYTCSPGESASGADLDFAFSSDSSQVIITTFADEFDLTETYTGALFTVTIDPSSPLGYFGYHGFSSNPSTFSVEDDLGSASAAFSITIEAVPEPATMAALVLGTTALIRRRKRA